ncbi:MAG: hypothetical protein OES20_16530 [Gammaproteobacteria bacterium]|nr:hypothetical protein [Gammaproteobacteria bacterium]MDH3857394.1 hypothetical protein [Gammaproteobacteria bacterium]
MKYLMLFFYISTTYLPGAPLMIAPRAAWIILDYVKGMNLRAYKTTDERPKSVRQAWRTIVQMQREIERLEKDLTGCIKLIASQETEINRLTKDAD